MLTLNSTNKRSSVLVAVMMWCGTFAHAYSDAIDTPSSPAVPMPFSAVYDVHHSGARVGEMTLKLAVIDSNSQHTLYEMTSHTEPRGLATFFQQEPIIETSHFEWTDEAQLHGTYYAFSDGSRKGKRNSQIDFDWGDAIATSSYKNETTTIPLKEAIADRLSLKALLMRDVSRGTLQTSYQFIDRNQLKTYHFEILGDEVMDTPAGRFETLKIKQRSEGSSRSIHLWLAREHHFIIVKLMQFKDNKPRTVVTLKALDEPSIDSPDESPDEAPDEAHNDKGEAIREEPSASEPVDQ